MSIDLIVLSDSHGRAISEGAKAFGLNTRELSFSGNGWHTGRFRCGKNGFFPVANKQRRRVMTELQDELGEKNVMKAGIPVVSTIGFNLGRLVPPFGYRGHRALHDDVIDDEELLFVSDDFIEDYITAFRAKHFATARKMSKAGNLIIIPPPIFLERANFRVFREKIKNRLRTVGATVFDPMDELADSNGLLSEVFDAGDQEHANGAYGQEVVKCLQNNDLI